MVFVYKSVQKANLTEKIVFRLTVILILNVSVQHIIWLIRS